MALTLEDAEKTLAEQAGKIKILQERLDALGDSKGKEELEFRIKKMQEQFDGLHAVYSALTQDKIGDEHHCHWCL